MFTLDLLDLHLVLPSRPFVESLLALLSSAGRPVVALYTSPPHSQFIPMTLIDLRSIPLGQEFNSDVLIVGAGVAGLVLADSLRGSGLTVDILEAGGASLEPESQALYEAEIVGIPHCGTTEGRFRVYGGSSSRWGGQLLPLPPSDFIERAHIRNSGWPIKFEHLSPYLMRSESLLKVNHLPFDTCLLDYLPHPLPALKSDQLRLRFSKWAPFHSRNLAKTLGKRCQSDPNIRIFLHACVTAIKLHEDGRHVDRLLAATPDGGLFPFVGRQVVISAGTIETCRLLLASSDVHHLGIANQYDQLGRWFHDHLSVKAATLHPVRRREFLKKFSPWFIGGTRHSVKFESTEAWQAHNHCLNVMGHLVFQAPENSGFAWIRQQLLARQTGDNTLQAIARPSFADLPSEILDLIYLGWKRSVRARRWCPTNAQITLSIDTEQQPSPTSRISISTNRDALGMPKAVVDWQWGEAERHTFSSFKNLFHSEWKAWNYGDIRWSETFEPGTGWDRRVSDIYHLMGGTRMHNDPKQGIVDENLRVHGIHNLSVASLSVFPTGGSSNPTFTLMMMTLRLSDRLRNNLG